MLEHNKALVQENELLKAQLGSTQELLNELRTTQRGKIAALADKLQEQVRAGNKQQGTPSVLAVWVSCCTPWGQASATRTRLHEVCVLFWAAATGFLPHSGCALRLLPPDPGFWLYLACLCASCRTLPCAKSQSCTRAWTHC